MCEMAVNKKLQSGYQEGDDHETPIIKSAFHFLYTSHLCLLGSLSAYSNDTHIRPRHMLNTLTELAKVYFRLGFIIII